MRERLPDYLKRGIIDTEKTKQVRRLLKSKGLNTVCDAARCPNKGECYAAKTATFLALGDICTRNCRFCSVPSGNPSSLNPNEPQLIKEVTEELDLKYVVITMVTRDDLPDGGMAHIKSIIDRLKTIKSPPRVEVLISDIEGKKESLEIVLDSDLDVLNHNIETVKSLYSTVRPKADYKRSLYILKQAKLLSPKIKTKTGMMLGLGENKQELIQTFNDLSDIQCDILTAGQYIQPTKSHYKVDRYLSQDEFSQLETCAKSAGIRHTAFGPLVRSSYKAKELFSL